MAEESKQGHDVTVVAVPGIASARAFGTPKVTVTMPIEWMKAGFLGAAKRFETAASDPASAGNARDVCIAAQEAAQWLDSLDERVDLGADTHVQALRFVRNSTHHQWGAAIYQEPETGDWLWYQRATLPLPDPKFPNKRGERLYDQVLAERPVRTTFQHLRSKVEKLT
jgi:hypothetical protein